MSLFYQDCINIYTDASCKDLSTELGTIKSTCPGFVATYQGRVLDHGVEIYIDETSIFGEAKAIQMAVNWIFYAYARSIRPPVAFNVFSDNNAVIAKINGSLIRWFKKFNKDGQFVPQYTEDFPLTSWQYIVYQVASMIFMNGLPIRLFYTPGHVPIWNVPFKGFESSKKKMIELNNPYHGNMSEEFEAYIVHEAASFNNIVDITTRNYLFRNRFLIEADINRYGNQLIFGDNKPNTLRWPFVVMTEPNYVGNTMPLPHQNMMMLNMARTR